MPDTRLSIDHLARIHALAKDSHMCADVSNSSLHGMSERAEQLLGRIALALAPSETLGAALTATLERICAATGWDVGEAWLPQIDPSGERMLRFGASWSVQDRQLQAFTTQAPGLRFSHGQGVLGAAWSTGAPVLVEDIQHAPTFTRLPLATLGDLRSMVAFPVATAAEVVAVLVFFARHPIPGDTEWLRLIGDVTPPIAELLQQKQSEDAHHLTEAKLAGMIAIAIDAIISIDHARRITLFNWGAERIFGYSAAEAIGQPIDILIPEELRSRHAAHIAAFGASSVTTRRMGERARIVGLRKNGEIFPAEASISRFATADEWTYTVILRDISERTRAEEELRTLAEQLQASVTAREQIMAIVSHDLRNPVTAMQLCLSALRDPEDPPTPEIANSLLDAAQESAAMMSRLIQDLLDVSSIEAGRLAMDRTAQPLAPVLHRAADLEYTLIKDYELAFVVDVDMCTDVVVNVDAERILQALANIIENARKFTPVSGTISLSAVPYTDHVDIIVRDTGPGIPPDELPHIFERFWHARHGAPQRSTGLGLTIARGIAVAHDGDLRAESTAGEGSTFILTLPREPG